MDKIVAAIGDTFAGGCSRPGFRLVHYSLQGNHAHLIVEAQDRETIGRGMKSIGSRLALAVNRVSGHSGRVLADRYHMRLLRTPREVRNALRYVLLNARHHVAKLRDRIARSRHAVERDVRLDPASSAEWFDGWKAGTSAAPNATGRAAAGVKPPVARAKTWLLRVGWRRHGLLDPADVPG